MTGDVEEEVTCGTLGKHSRILTDEAELPQLQIQSRVNYNLSYFSSNYAAVIASMFPHSIATGPAYVLKLRNQTVLGIWGLLTNLTLLFVLVFVVVGVFAIGKLEGRDLDVGFARAVSETTVTQLRRLGC
jgi:hypothetical protein